MSVFGRGREKLPAEVLGSASLPRGERVLAHARDGERWLLGTRRALTVVVPGEEPVRLLWEAVQAADWDRDQERLVVSEIGRYGSPRASYTFTLDNPAALLQLIRERVTASVVLQRGYLVTATQGFKVIARRPPDGGEIAWMFEYDAGIDPDDPDVVTAADEALARARSDTGQA